MSIDLQPSVPQPPLAPIIPSQIVFKSTGTGANSYALHLQCPASITDANRNISLYDPGSDCDIALGVKRIVQVPDAVTLAIGANQSGSVFMIPPQTAPLLISLPAVLAGLEYKFVMQGTAGQIITIQATAVNLMAGNLLRSAGAAATDAVVSVSGNRRSVTFGATAVVGDHVRVVCDGVRWYASGQSSVAAGLVFA